MEFSSREIFEWGGRTFYTGSAAFHRWIDALRLNEIHGFYMGYFADLLHESRKYAHLFLAEASQRFEGSLSAELKRAANDYRLVEEECRALTEMFPWGQPHAPIQDPDRRREAMDVLTRIKRLDIEGQMQLTRLLEHA